MKYMAKYSQVCWNDDVKPTQKRCQQTLYTQELCSNVCKDNYALFENTSSPTNIISKGFFQFEAQKALQNSQIEKAFEIAEQYISTSKRKFYRFLDVETKKVIISKQLNRFDAICFFRKTTAQRTTTVRTWTRYYAHYTYDFSYGKFRLY